MRYISVLECSSEWIKKYSWPDDSGWMTQEETKVEPVRACWADLHEKGTIFYSIIFYCYIVKLPTL